MMSFVTFFKVLQIFGLQFSPSHYAFAATVCDGASCANDEADTTQTFFIQKRAGLVGKHDVKGKDAEVENAHLEKIIRDAEMQDPTCKFESLICGCGGATPPPTPVPPTPVPPTPAPTLPPTPPMNTEGDGHCVGATGKLVPMWWRGDTPTSQCREYCLANTDCVAYSMANPRNQCYQHVASSVTNVAGFQLHPWSTDAGRGFEQPPVMGADRLGGQVNEYTCYYNAASSLREKNDRLQNLNQRNNHLRELVKEKETQDPRCLLPDMICGCGAATPATPPPPTPSPTPSPTPTPTPAPTTVPSTSVLPMSDVSCSVEGDSYGGSSYSCANMYTQTGGYGHSWLTSDCHSQPSCMDTAWFMVDLQGNRYIDTIKIWPRSPPDQYRSSEYEILISDTPTTGTRGTAFAQASEGFTQVATNQPMGNTDQEYVHDVQQSAQYVMFHALQWNRDNNGNQFDGLRGAGVHYMKFVASGLSGSM